MTTSALQAVGRALLTVATPVAVESLSRALPLPADTPIQLLIPSPPWTWEQPVSGTLPEAMLQFCDAIPNSCAPFAQYARSGNAFFESYTSFLDLIDPSGFLSPARLRAAIAKVQVPSGDPASQATPDGWTKAEDSSGIVRWRPAWSLSVWPRDWLGLIATRGGNPGTITVPIEDDSETLTVHKNSDAPEAITLRPDQVHHVKISAQAWNRIAITPGSWFDSGLIELVRVAAAHGSPFRGQLTAAEVFGTILTCRITELVVAYKIQVDLDVTQAFVAAHGATLAQAQRLSVLSFDVAAPSGAPVVTGQPSATGATYTAQSTSDWPDIVGVIVASVAP